ncbi:MAG: VCBS repeat-containing protein [Acidobacteriota bacterium]
MDHPTRRLGRVLWVTLAWLVLVAPLAAAAEESLSADFDGDGRRDQVTLDRREPSTLQVWLSASDTTQVIHTGVPMVRVIAADLDGDHRPELVASGSEWQLQAWTCRRQTFQLYRPHLGVPGTQRQPARRSVDDHDSEPAAVVTGTAFAPLATVLCAAPRPPSLATSNRRTPDGTGSSRPFPSVDPFAPRPPPTRFLL